MKNEQSEKRGEMFAANLAMQDIYKISDSSTKKRTSFSSYTKENILDWLKSPSSNAANLRAASEAMYLTSPRYAQLINHRANMWLLDYILVPTALDESRLSEDKFRNQYIKAVKKVELWNIKHEMRKAALGATKDGVYYGVSWESGDGFFIQRIDPSFCSIYAVVDGTYLFTVDMSKIKESELDLYPPQFKTMYDEYKKTKQREQPVPSEITWCLPFDESDLNAFIPPYAGILPELLDIEQYRNIQESITELSNYKVLFGRIETDDKGIPIVNDKLSKKYYDHLCKAVPPQVGVAVAPFRVEAFNFDQSKEVASIDIVSRAVEQFWNSSGTSSILHGGEVTTSGGLTMVEETEANQMRGLLMSMERLVNRHLKEMSGTYKFKIQFLPTTIYNREDMIKVYKEAATYGVAPSMYFASIGMLPGDLVGLNAVEDKIVDLSRLRPLMSSHTMSSDDVTGRPASDDSELTDEGERTRNKE